MSRFGQRSVRPTPLTFSGVDQSVSEGHVCNVGLGSVRGRRRLFKHRHHLQTAALAVLGEAQKDDGLAELPTAAAKRETALVDRASHPRSKHFVESFIHRFPVDRLLLTIEPNEHWVGQKITLTTSLVLHPGRL